MYLCVYLYWMSVPVCAHVHQLGQVCLPVCGRVRGGSLHPALASGLPRSSRLSVILASPLRGRLHFHALVLLVPTGALF